MTQKSHDIDGANVIKFQGGSAKLCLVKQHREADGEVGLTISVTVMMNS
jgi:hypothetical protein